jgi:serpin B
MNWKEFLKPNRKKILLTIVLLLLAGALFFMMFFVGIPVPKGLTILKILGLPFNLASIGMSWFSVILLFVLTIFWLYLVSSILILIKNIVVSIKWDAKKFIALAIIIVVGIVVYGFINLGFGDIFIPTADDSGATQQGIAEIVKANNQFAVDLYSKIGNESDKNVFFSPWSISDAIAMTYEGARGQTADEIKSVFHFPEDNNLRRSSFASILNTINKGSGKYELHTANAIWLQKDYPFLKEYKNTISRYYLGEVKNLDFVNNPSGSSNEINNWVAKNTNNKIKEIVSPDLFNPLTRAVLTNAIYFKGKWEHQFGKEDTKPEDFTLNSGEKVKVPMMSLTNDDLNFDYAEADGMQILEMKYQGDKISMLVLLPRSNITYLESILSEEKLQEWRSELRPETVYIHMPKYKFETSYSLTDYLKNMGMNLPFTWPGADFSGMDGTKMLYISDVLHKAYIDVYEEGTEAAAATVVIGTFGAAMPHYVEFRADHPFIFIIQETDTGNILFLGKVVNPIQ